MAETVFRMGAELGGSFLPAEDDVNVPKVGAELRLRRQARVAEAVAQGNG